MEYWKVTTTDRRQRTKEHQNESHHQQDQDYKTRFTFRAAAKRELEGYCSVQVIK